MEEIQLVDVIYVDRDYSRKHPHMIHRHADCLELLYIVGDREYAVTAGDFVICNAKVPHGEDPFQEHHIQTYCLVLSNAELELAADERPIVSTGKDNYLSDLLPQIYHLFHKKTATRKLAVILR